MAWMAVLPDRENQSDRRDPIAPLRVTISRQDAWTWQQDRPRMSRFLTRSPCSWLSVDATFTPRLTVEDPAGPAPLVRLRPMTRHDR